MANYAELQCTSHFSFLRGASSCEELFTQAGVYELGALAITDRNSLAGIARAHQASKVTGIQLIVGCRLDLMDGSSVLVYPTDRAAYGRLCRLLTVGKKRAGKAKCDLRWDDVEEYGKGLIGILVPDEANETYEKQLQQVVRCFGRDGFVSLTLRRRPDDQLRLYNLTTVAAKAGVRPVVTNDALFHVPERRVMQDVMTCIRNKCTIDQLGYRREQFADRHLLPPHEMHRVYQQYPAALARTMEIAHRCKFSLDELQYQYPKEVIIPGLTSQQSLEKLTWKGANGRYPAGIPPEVIKLLRHELGLIAEMEYAPYFLTVNSIVRFARSKDILCQGRGSAANSAVCYVLGITSVDPTHHNLLFERFISQERKEPPDIDVDFEHERREIVMQWVLDTYGRDRAAICSTYVRYKAKGAIRDVGKVLGLPKDILDALSSQVWAWSQEGIEDKHAKELNLNMNDPRLRLSLKLAREIIGTPRHLSQHSGGFVLTNDRLDEFVPIEPASMEGRQVIEWDKDDIDIVKFMKVDCLSLGMLSCLKRSFDLLESHKNIKHDLASIPADDLDTFAMIRKADTLGVFQIESRAQMNSLPRTKPNKFYDLVVQVAIVRPGPIQGNMVHPYLKRKNGQEKVEYPTPELENILSKTLGVPLFQEQAMQVAITCAGFTPSEADLLRRSMATFKFTGGVIAFKEKLVNGMLERGYKREFAENMMKQLEGFGSYGFPESHAASFAILAYISSWMKCHHPDVFCIALVNSQPMGFYAVAQVVRDAREHGVEVRGICINTSRWDCALESKDEGAWHPVRLGMRLIKKLPNEHAASIITARMDAEFTSVEDVWRRANVPVSALEHLARADAFKCFGLSRRDALWAIKALRDQQLPLFAAADARTNQFKNEIIEPEVVLKKMTAGSEVVEDYTYTSLTLRDHPLSFLRQSLTDQRIVTCAQINEAKDGSYWRTAGMVLVRQKPGSAKGVLFITIEDETGTCNVVVWPSLFEKMRRVIFMAGMLAINGKVQREGSVVHLVANQLWDYSDALASVGDKEIFPITFPRGDELKMGGGAPDHRAPKPLFEPRDIYIPDIHIDTIKVKTRDFR